MLGPELGDLIRGLHEEHGVVFHLGRKARGVADGAVVLETASGSPADLLVAGIGVRPNLELAEEAGLALDRGVRRGRAAGDQRTGHLRRGRHRPLARPAHRRDAFGSSTGCWPSGRARPPPATSSDRASGSTRVPFFWSQHYDMAINYVGHAERWDRIEIDGDLGSEGLRGAVPRGRQVLAVATVGRDQASLEAEARDGARGSARGVTSGRGPPGR